MTGPNRDPAAEKLRRAVIGALWRSEPIRALDLATLQVEVLGSTVVLRGLVASEAHKYAAGQLAGGVLGVGKVINELVTDEELERRVAVALASNNASREHRIAVRVAGGIASLYGSAPTREIAEAVRGVAAAVPRVLGIESKLHIVPPGAPVILAWQRSVEGRPLPESPGSPVSEGPAAVDSGQAPPKASPKVAGMEGSA